MTRKRHKKQSKPLVDIIIPVHGRFDLLEQCLEAIPAACGNIQHNVILIDNASPQEEADEFYSKHDGFTLIRNYENVGYAKANNQGVNKGKSPLLLLLNSDVILQPNSVDLLVRDLDDPTIGIVGAHLVFPEYAGGLNQQIRPANKTQHIGMETNIRGHFGHIFVGWSSDHPKVQAMRETYAVTGACMLTRRKIYKQVNGLDEAYGVGTYEDVDFSLKVREIGYNIIVNPKAMGTHYTGATAEYYRIQFPLEQNRMIFLQRWSTKLEWTEWEKY